MSTAKEECNLCFYIFLTVLIFDLLKYAFLGPLTLGRVSVDFTDKNGAFPDLMV